MLHNIIGNLNMFKLFNDMKVNDISEFSDHCAICFDINFDNVFVDNHDDVRYGKIEWDNCNIDELNVCYKYHKQQVDCKTGKKITN